MMPFDQTFVNIRSPEYFLPIAILSGHQYVVGGDKAKKYLIY
jgi:hypothetical protein